MLGESLGPLCWTYVWSDCLNDDDDDGDDDSDGDG